MMNFIKKLFNLTNKHNDKCISNYNVNNNYNYTNDTQFDSYSTTYENINDNYNYTNDTQFDSYSTTYENINDNYNYTNDTEFESYSTTCENINDNYNYANGIIENNIFGQFGESEVIKRLMKLPQKDYYIFNNLNIVNGKYSAQIDHLILSKFGIFVIETKNRSGNIYGNVHSKKWCAYVNNIKYEFFNPVMQNESHIKTIAYKTGIPIWLFHNIVVFTNKGKIKTSEIIDVITNINDLNSKILSYTNVKINGYQMQKYYHIFKEFLY